MVVCSYNRVLESGNQMCIVFLVFYLLIYLLKYVYIV